MNEPHREIIIMQIFVIFVLPVFLLYFNIVPDTWRFFFLAVSALFIYGIIKYERWNHIDLGLRHDNIKASLPYYLGFSLLIFIALFLVDGFFHLGGEITNEFLIKTLILFVPVSFLQQFAFSVFLIPRLKLIFKKNIWIILSGAVLFSFIHIIFPDLAIGIPVSFIGGAIFIWVYIKHPNFLLIALSHSILNVTAVLLGFFNL